MKRGNPGFRMTRDEHFKSENFELVNVHMTRRKSFFFF